MLFVQRGLTKISVQLSGWKIHPRLHGESATKTKYLCVFGSVDLTRTGRPGSDEAWAMAQREL